MKEVKDTMGLRIRVVQKLKKMTQVEFAAWLGISQASLSYIESDRRAPSVEVLQKIAQAGFSIEWLLTGETETVDSYQRVNEIAIINQALPHQTDQEIRFIKNFIKVLSNAHAAELQMKLMDKEGKA